MNRSVVTDLKRTYYFTHHDNILHDSTCLVNLHSYSCPLFSRTANINRRIRELRSEATALLQLTLTHIIAI